MTKINTKIKGTPEEWEQKAKELGVFGVKNSKTFVEWITGLFFDGKVKIEHEQKVNITQNPKDNA